MATVADRSGNAALYSSFDQWNRSNAGDPNTVGPLTPQYAGEIVLDTTNHQYWYAAGLTSSSWIVRG